MNLTIIPKPLAGTVTVPSSKSMTHRMILGGALAAGESVIENISSSADITVTIGCVENLGASCTLIGSTATVSGAKPLPMNTRCLKLDCGESGSTLRFIIPLALALGGQKKITLTGKGRLMERPLEPYFELFEKAGVEYRLDADKLMLRGNLPTGTLSISGKISSQFITGLLYALPLAAEDSEILIPDHLESRGYVDLTLEALQCFGIRVENQEYRRFVIPGNQQYKPYRGSVEGDYSQAAFFLAANFIGSDVHLDGLRADSSQGDREVAGILEQYHQPKNLEIDVSEIPDSVPALAAAAAYREGRTTRFSGAARLRIKESDRIASTTSMIQGLGGEVEAGADYILVTGKKSLNGGTVNCQNDHRIAMAAAIAAVGCICPVTLIGAECVEKSYPAFWDDYQKLGGKIH